MDAYPDAVVQEDRLWIADPKAVHRILQGSGYLYGKPGHSRELIVTLLDRGLAWAEGEPSLKFFTL